MKDNIVYLSIGSNIGERIHYLKFAITALLKDVNISRLRMSSIYETVPIGYTKQDEFLNMVVEIYTTYKPVELLYVTKEIQNLAGRKKSIRWGPRTLDLDILLYNQENVEMEHLQIPHPRMFERGFVII